MDIINIYITNLHSYYNLFYINTYFIKISNLDNILDKISYRDY